ncbi:hypothetical protein J437_LFUL010654 [Ladona fulva]|uniref:PiggyBac transposable element-derived protein domain-containing protein n=1 Tax=Ladona fulva TaxID=123851 RepID=A0A8K0KRR0_LADFU|nr:hypothetical protein J437_LFUL010654 [Ladona fulva]
MAFRRNSVGDREEFLCPEAIADYNRNMGGVDKFDQYLSVYSIGRKSYRWWETTKQKGYKSFSHLNFRSQLVNEMIGSFSSKKKLGYLSTKGFEPLDLRQFQIQCG